ncbi:hypothetical protein TI04_10900 [Achromatium sp. WMS2]|nr:hypothetical protein TI04_10900 [Achromatium sp. WMS2]
MKRVLDVILVALAITVLFFPLIIIAVLIRLKLGSPVIFSQIRPGLHGKLFTVYKFRTMTNAKDSNGELLPDAERLTHFGSWLRATSLDEFPALFNVLRGDMSLVGPRPLLAEYLPLYSEQQAKRHEVLPGITGLAQISGRNTLLWEEKFNLDLWYVENRSLCLDIKILFLTVKKVIMRDGISAPGEATMPKFKGTNG